MLTDCVVPRSTDVVWPCVLNLLWLVRYTCCAAEGPGAITAKMVSRAARLTSRATAEAAVPNQLPTNLQGALMAREDDNPLFLGGLRPTAANAVTDAMGAAIATGLPALAVMMSNSVIDNAIFLALVLACIALAYVVHLSLPVCFKLSATQPNEEAARGALCA